MGRTKQEPKSAAQLLAEYLAFPDDQAVAEPYAAARLGYSRAWLQLKRGTGGGPRFNRTRSGKIRYVKLDVERYRAEDLTAFDSTSQYPAEQAA